MDLRDSIIDEIKTYCKDNGIKNVRNEILKYIRIGFSIERYGTSPMDNFRREQVKPKPPKVKGSPVAENTTPQRRAEPEPVKAESGPATEITSPKQHTGPKIRIIKK